MGQKAAANIWWTNVSCGETITIQGSDILIPKHNKGMPPFLRLNEAHIDAGAIPRCHRRFSWTCVFFCRSAFYCQTFDSLFLRKKNSKSPWNSKACVGARRKNWHTLYSMCINKHKCLQRRWWAGGRQLHSCLQCAACFDLCSFGIILPAPAWEHVQKQSTGGENFAANEHLPSQNLNKWQFTLIFLSFCDIQ